MNYIVAHPIPAFLHYWHCCTGCNCGGITSKQKKISILHFPLYKLTTFSLGRQILMKTCQSPTATPHSPQDAYMIVHEDFWTVFTVPTLLPASAAATSSTTSSNSGKPPRSNFEKAKVPLIVTSNEPVEENYNSMWWPCQHFKMVTLKNLK